MLPIMRIFEMGVKFTDPKIGMYKRKLTFGDLKNQREQQYNQIMQKAKERLKARKQS